MIYKITHLLTNKSPAGNSRFAKAGVSCFYDSEVLNSSFVHLMMFSAKNPRLRKAAKRCGKIRSAPFATSVRRITSADVARR